MIHRCFFLLLAPGTVLRSPRSRFSATVHLVQTLEMGLLMPMFPLVMAINKDVVRTHPIIAVLLIAALCLATTIHAQRSLETQRQYLERIAQGFSYRSHPWLVLRALLIMSFCVVFVLFGLYVVARAFYS